MKLALFATLLAFGGSLAGFGVVSSTTGAETRVTASPPTSTEQVIVSPAADDSARRDRDCPKDESDRA